MQRIGLIALTVIFGALGAGVLAQELKPALTAQTEFLSSDGTRLSAVAAGEPIRIRVTVASGYSETPPAGLSLFGWLRRIGQSDLPCGQTAESFLRTGRLPTGTIFLNDPVIGVVTEDNSFILSDPEFSLASANIVGATLFDSRPSALTSDPDNRRFLLALPHDNLILGIGASGEEVLRIDDLIAPLNAVTAPNGAVLALQSDGQLVSRARHALIPLATGVTAIRPSLDPRWTVALKQGEALLVDMQNASIAQSIQAVGLRDAAVLLEPDTPAPFAMAVLNDAGIAIHYLDAPDAAINVALQGDAVRLAASPHGRVLLAWSPVGGKINVIDVARGQLVRAVGANAAFSEVAFFDETAFLMLDSQTHVGALDLSAIARGEDANFREIQIGTATDVQETPRQLLAPLWPMEGMLAVHADSYQGYRIMDGSVMGDAPAMTATSLRGGIPRLVSTLDRSFVENEPGIFETVASLPGAGRFELVATTGLGALSFCAEVPVADPDGLPDRQTGTLVAGWEGETLRITAIGPDDSPGSNLNGEITFSALEGGWRASVPFTTDAAGVSEAAYALPNYGEIVVRLEADGPYLFEPLLLEDLE